MNLEDFKKEVESSNMTTKHTRIFLDLIKVLQENGTTNIPNAPEDEGFYILNTKEEISWVAYPIPNKPNTQGRTYVLRVKDGVMQWEVDEAFRETIYKIIGQDAVNGLNVERIKNGIGIDFEFKRLGEGSFTCIGLDKSKHILQSVIYGESRRLLLDSAGDLLTMSGNFPDDNAFVYGGWIMIRELDLPLA